MSAAAPGAKPTPVMVHTSSVAAPADPGGLPVGIVGLVLIVAGAILQLVAFLSATWLDAAADRTSARVRLGFGDFTDRTQRGFAHIYFAWGAWVLFAVVLACGVAGCIRWRGSHVFRVVGPLIAVFGAFATVAGVLVFAYQTDVEIFHVARNYSAGVYLAMLGLLASAFGAAAGEVGT